MENKPGVHFVEDDGLGKDAIVALVNGNFVDVENAMFFDPKVQVLIQNGCILAMPGLPGEPADIQPDVTVDLQGKTVLPGLFNVHCHVQMINPTVFSDFATVKARKAHHDRQVEKNMAECLAHGITNIRDAFTDHLQPNRELRSRIGRREIPGPRIQQAVVVGPRGGYLSPEFRGMKKILLGLLGLGAMDYEDTHSGVIAFPPDATLQEVRDAVDRAVDERGADLIKVGESLEQSLLNPDPTTMPLEQLQIITDQARRRGVNSTIHCVSAETFRRAVQVGFSSLAHMARDEDLTPADIEACLHSESIIEPTLSVGYDMSWRLDGDPFRDDANLEALYRFRNRTFAELADGFWVPELADCVKAGFQKANQGKYKMLGIINLSKLLAHFSRLARYGIENTKTLFSQGAVMACGNDGGIQSCTPAMIGHELALFDLFLNEEAPERKFDGAAAVRTATIHSARSMGVEETFGSIRTGKVADLAVVEGNPFEDIGVIGKPVDALFMDGRLTVDNCGLTE